MKKITLILFLATIIIGVNIMLTPGKSENPSKKETKNPKVIIILETEF